MDCISREQEAKLTELITLVTNYSCGKELCDDGAASLALDWAAEYRECGTNFIKASTWPESISKQLTKVYKMDPSQRNKMGKQATKWTMDNYSAESIGKQIEAFLDGLNPVIDFDFEDKKDVKFPNAEIPNIVDNAEWITTLYNKILNTKPDDDGFKYWNQQLAQGMPRQKILDFFRQTAQNDNAKNQQVKFEDLLDKNDIGKRILIVIPESIGDVFLVTSLFESIKEQYPWGNLYIATKPENMTVLDGNPYVFKVIPYMPQMDNQPWLEGIGNHAGFFELSYDPYFGTQRLLDYLNNGKTNIAFDIKEIICI